MCTSVCASTDCHLIKAPINNRDASVSRLSCLVIMLAGLHCARGKLDTGIAGVPGAKPGRLKAVVRASACHAEVVGSSPGHADLFGFSSSFCLDSRLRTIVADPSCLRYLIEMGDILP